MFESPERLALGFITGVLFGVFLQKGRVAKHSVITSQLVLRDNTVVKVMLTAVAVGAVGFWALYAFDVTLLEVKPAEMGGLVLGALLFGAGMAALGYCPGTTMAAAGEGNRDALVGMLGMFAGAFAFVRLFPAVDRVQSAIVDLGELTLPKATETPPFVWVVLLGVIAIGMYARTRRADAKH